MEEVVSEPIFDFKFDPVLGAAVLVAVAGLFGVIAGVILVKRGINRKRLLLLSGLGTAIAFLILGIYFHYDSTGKCKMRKHNLANFFNIINSFWQKPSVILQPKFICLLGTI